MTPSVNWNHRTIHRQALAAKKMAEELSNVLSGAVNIINFIKLHPVHSGGFAKKGVNFTQWCLHAVVQGLSRGKMLTTLRELQEEVHIFSC